MPSPGDSQRMLHPVVTDAELHALPMKDLMVLVGDLLANYQAFLELHSQCGKWIEGADLERDYWWGLHEQAWKVYDKRRRFSSL